ncbi:YeiH family protein [Georgenia sp. Z1491]|uniref:YeiH family protein n=1 Tax=Georgenia sp. Z1491 TaxID=3416707 RepID=UPI003CF25167
MSTLPTGPGVRDRLPGLAVAVAIAVVATLVGRAVPVLGSAVAGVVIGVVLGQVRRPGPVLAPGLSFSAKRVLQLAVVLLGVGMSLGRVWEVGVDTLPVMLGTLAACFLAAVPLGRLLGVDGELRTLITVGTGICGASAIAATAPVIRAKGASIAYAVSTIFLFNVAAVLLFPPLGRALGMSDDAFGLFAGTAVNDTSSVVAAASVFGAAATGYAVVVKLARTLMIIPVSVTLAVREQVRERRAAGRAGVEVQRLTVRSVVGLVPWFLVGFLLMAALTTIGAVPESVQPYAGHVATFLITMALAAIGLQTDIQAFRRAGWRPLAFGGLLWVVVAVSSLAIMRVTGAF